MSSTVVIRGAPSTSSSVQAALTATRSGGVLFSPSTSASAIAKQLACAPAMSSSGLVLPSGRSVRDVPRHRELVQRAASARQRPGAAARNAILDATRRLGRKIWKKWTGYHRRSLVETKMRCFKLLGERVMARDFDRQVAELQVRAAILNRFTRLGTPTTVAVTMP